MAVAVCMVAATAATATPSVPAVLPQAALLTVVVDPVTLPRGPEHSGPWVDLRDEVVHRPGPDLAVELDDEAWHDRVERVAAGYLFGAWPLWRIESEELKFFGDDGSARQLAPGLLTWDEDDAGTHVAYTRFHNKTARSTLEVAEIATGTVLATRRAGVLGVQAFDGANVWLSELEWGDFLGERLTRWNLATGNLTRPPRLSFAERVDNNALVAFGSRKNLPAPDTVAPLDPAAGWGPWTARGDILAAAVSPDRQLIATIEDKTRARVVRIMRLTTGKAIQEYRGTSYPGFSGSLLMWENDQHVLVYGFHTKRETRAVLRLSTTGTAERISPFRQQAREIVPISEP